MARTYYSWRTQTHYDTKEARDSAHKEAKKNRKGRSILTDIGDFIKSGRAKKTMEKSESPQIVKEDQVHTKTVPANTGQKFGSFKTDDKMEKKVGATVPGAKGVSVKTKGGEFPVYRKSSTTAKSFKQAFRQARIDKKDTFKWQGRTYSTELKK